MLTFLNTVRSWAYLPLSFAASFLIGVILYVQDFRKDIYVSFGIGLGFIVGFIIVAILDHVFNDDK
jgi:hypothetical protein